MSGKFTYVELEVLNKIFMNVDIKEFTEEEYKAFGTLKEQLKQDKERRDKEREITENIYQDFNKQIETHNFKLMCGACRGNCHPKCLGLYEKKYCNGIFECKNKIKNPDYKEET